VDIENVELSTSMAASSSLCAISASDERFVFRSSPCSQFFLSCVCELSLSANGEQEAFEKCWAHSPLRAAAHRLFYIAIHQVSLLSHAVKIGHSIAEMLQFFVFSRWPPLPSCFF